MSVKNLLVEPDKLTRVCDSDDLGFETTEEVAPLEGTIGQERAISALELALNIDAPGFNLFVAGLPGTGRNTAIRSRYERIAATKPVPPDWGYVYNFQDPSQPVAICLPCGMMRALARDMDELVNGCRQEIPTIFESDEYNHRIQEVMKEVQEKRQSLTNKLEKEAQQAGFTLSTNQMGITPVPLVEGKPISQEDYGQLPEEQRDEIKRRAEGVGHSITHFMQEARRLNKEAAEHAREVDTELARFALKPIIDELQEKYAEYPDVVTYLDQVEADMVQRLDIFKPREETAAPSATPPTGPGEEDLFVRYRVNELVDNTMCVGAPVIIEYSPTYYNLFGHIDYQARIGTLTTNLTMIKPGAIHRANGGYLVLQARDLLTSPLSWDALKRSLRGREVRIENIGEQYNPLPSATLRPQAIPVNTKIVLVGGTDLLRLLQTLDEDFRRYFKVTADFDTVMDRTPENMSKYAAFVAARCLESGLRPFHKMAVARIIEYSGRLVEDQERLTTRFMDIADIITESDFWAGKEDGAPVMGDHVNKAIEQRRYRASLTDERLQELIENGTIHIATEGRAVGQVNGLAVYSVGDYSFGKPSRITARVSLGRGQVINVERETRMSGRIHDKGFMILTGYLKGEYGRDKPLSLSASIGFEQTYGEVDGDSASSTELYSLLSAISGLPIDQGIAVTGSVNQAGEVQAIGGAIHKIEGYYKICKARGDWDKQGVMIPRDNLRNLVLDEEVIDAVREGRFHIYAVSNVDEGIEILTGVPAGERGEDGSYPEGTVHYLVEDRLRVMAEKAREFGKEDEARDDQGS
jgi:lon-related putative ATP-dependent protease